MRQRAKQRAAGWALIASALLFGGCKRSLGVGAANSGRASDKAATRPTVASLVPSGTDLLLASGMGGHLVAVSTYCRANPKAVGFPAVGDYLATDWEKLGQIKPDILLVFMAADRIPAGLRERASANHVAIEIIKVEHVADVSAMVLRLGELTHEPGLARSAVAKMESARGEIAERAAKRGEHPNTLIVIGPAGESAIGAGGFLDEILKATGARNAAESVGDPYPSLDFELMRKLAPERIIHLMPGATEPQVAQAAALWKSRAAMLPAAGDVRILTQWYLLQPGAEIWEEAALFERALYPTDPRPDVAGGH